MSQSSGSSSRRSAMDLRVRHHPRARWMTYATALLVGLSTMVAAIAGPVSSDVQVKDAWIRWLPAGIPAGGYMTLVNTGSVTYTLVGATSPDYGQIGIHQTSEMQGMSEMRPVDSIRLKPHATVRFAEGSYHLMLMQPTRQIRVGDHVTVALKFADGQSIKVDFAVLAGQELLQH